MKQAISPVTGKIEIQMLGGFSVRVGDAEVVSTEAGGQIWNLMEYMICGRNKIITQEQLIEILWDDNVEDPAAALKNLVYRLRKAFADAGVSFAKQIILSSGGVYRFNNELPCTVDVEEYEAACQRADAEKDPEVKAAQIRRAVDLYTGDFLPGACHRAWVIPINRYYHALYFEKVYDLLADYQQNGSWQDMLDVATRAAQIDKFEEQAHSYILLALSKLGRQNQAIDHYNYISDLFYREMGAELSSGVRAMYSEIAQTITIQDVNLSILKDDLKEGDDSTGAYYCEYEIFRSLYHVKARSAQRDGSSVFLGLLTLKNPEGGKPEEAVRNTAMQALHRAITASLRSGDVFSRCSGCQYVVMLPNINMENAEMVLSRIARCFKATYHSRKIILDYYIQPLDPAVNNL